MTYNSIDEKFMKIAIDISRKAKYPYGAIIVKNGEIIGRSDTDTPVSQSAFAHAELIAIEDAMPHLGGHLCAEGGKEVTIYSSCEPCAMCMGAILYTGIERLVYAAALEDSMQVVNDILVKAKDVADACTNRNIEIISDCEKNKAINVMKEWNINNI